MEKNQERKNNPESLNVKLMPYCEVDGIQTFRDSEILGFYDRMVKAGTAETVFTDGKINNREDWLRAMKSPENFLYVVYDVDKEAVALFWLNRVEIKKARLHYSGFFKGWKKGSVKIGRQILEILMGKKNSDNDGYLFDMLTGLTPSSNKLAIKYMRLCGWKIIGELPFGTWNHKAQKSEPAVISYYTREAQDEGI
jgi:ribosomal protein L20